MNSVNEIKLIPWGFLLKNKVGITSEATYPSEYVKSLSGNSIIVIGGYSTSQAYLGAYIRVNRPQIDKATFTLMWMYSEEGAFESPALNIYCR